MMRFLALLLLVFAVSASERLRAGDRQVFLKVSPLVGESSTSKTGGGMIRQAVPLTSRNSSKTIVRNMKWSCEVRYRGEPKPEQVEVRAFYIGYEANDMTPKIIGRDVKTLTLDGNGKAVVELVSPTVRLQKTRTSSGYGGYSGRVSKTRSAASGQRMAGCVVRLFESGELVKSYASASQWERAAKARDFNDAVLNEKPKNRLN